MTFSTDGLPQHYYNVTQDTDYMASMRSQVFQAIDILLEHDGFTLDNITTDWICDQAGIDTLFINEVEDFYQEWREHHEN